MASDPFYLRVPVHVECPEPMRFAVNDVLSGEYEAHFDGEGLDILDIGANVGSFALWADRRWPGSRIHSFEPNPGTFAYLSRNTANNTRITVTNAALYPGLGARAAFHSRYAGDGEAGLAVYAIDTFVAEAGGEQIDVAVVDPTTLPSADVVKIDIEGGEAEVLAALDLSQTALVLAEFQNRKNRDQILKVMAGRFEQVVDVVHPWDPLLDYKGYRQDLRGDVFGNMYFAARGRGRLRRRGQPQA